MLVELMEARLPGPLPDTMLRRAAEKLYARTDKSVLEKFKRHAGILAPAIDQGQELLDTDTRQAAEKRFGECQRALGQWHRKFVLACRADLGYGPRPWQRSTRPRTGRWQVWRQPDPWPGGWPPPSGADLVSRARMEWEASPASAAEEAPDHR